MEFTTGKKILKTAGEREVFNYETYLIGKDFSVPYYYGKYIEEERSKSV